MTDAPLTSGDTAAQLRRAFDQSFADAIVTTSRETADFISIRLGDELHAIRMAQIAGLYKDITIVPMPSPVSELMGLAGFRSTVVPVYDLAALLGYPPTQGRRAVLEVGRAFALAFDEFDDHFRVDLDSIVPQQATSRNAFQHEIARQDARAWPIIDIPSILTALRKRMPRTAANKE